METIAQMKERARAQDAYGKWNTAPLWNEIARREDELRSPFERAVRKFGGYALVASAAALFYAPFAIAAYRGVKSFFVGG